MSYNDDDVTRSRISDATHLASLPFSFLALQIEFLFAGQREKIRFRTQIKNQEQNSRIKDSKQVFE